MKKCSKCGTINEDWARYCNYCGNLLDNDFTKQNTFTSTDNKQAHIGKNTILIGYIIAIIFGWGGIPLLLISSLNNFGFVGMVGLFLPLFLINSSNHTIKKHGYIQFFICLSGMIVGIILLFLMFKF